VAIFWPDEDNEPRVFAQSDDGRRWIHSHVFENDDKAYDMTDKIESSGGMINISNPCWIPWVPVGEDYKPSKRRRSRYADTKHDLYEKE
jgi:hypothetical protein